jgi:hypothetical protein
VTEPPDIWSEEPLLGKARVYIDRAAAVEAGSSLEALWSLIALELLARAALARVHPVLMADPQDGSHLLYAFGYGEPRPPKSVPAAMVFRRCQVVVPLFTEQLTRDAIALMALRNEELHTGGLVLETLRSSSWQPQYYSICEVLLAHLGLGLDEFFPADRASAARTVLDGLAEDVESSVKQRIADTRRWFEELDEEEQEARKRREPTSVDRSSREQIAACPACGSRALMAGETAGVSEPRAGEDQIERDIRVLPTRLRCSVCELSLDSHAELYHAGLGDEYSIVDSEDPLEYYGIDPKDYVTLEDLIEEDYGNE